MKQALLTLVVLASQGALAGNVFSDVTGSQPVCFGREYGVQHLKVTPKQTVQKIQAKLEKLPQYNDQQILGLEVTLKGSKNLYTNYRAVFTCFDRSGETVCGIDCDGGSVNLVRTESGKLTIENEGFILKGGCGEEGKTVFLKAVAGGDDKFVLTKLPPEMCQTTTDYPSN